MIMGCYPTYTLFSPKNISHPKKIFPKFFVTLSCYANLFCYANFVTLNSINSKEGNMIEKVDLIEERLLDRSTLLEKAHLTTKEQSLLRQAAQIAIEEYREDTYGIASETV